MRILLTGRNGQVGWELERALPALGELIATDRAILDLADPEAIRRVVRDAEPEVIVNAAAYTAVDQAESDPELAMRINGIAPGVLAEEAKRLGALLVHYSTDYVFDGTKAEPYLEADATKPINVYGATKLEGERAILAAGCRHLILRASWVYSLRGANFLLTVLRLARQRARIRIVADQHGTPTSATLIADATTRALRACAAGSAGPRAIFHLATARVASRHEFAVEAIRLLDLQCIVEQATSGEFPLPARRPAFSALATARFERAFDVVLPDWRADLDQCLRPIREGLVAMPG